MARKQEIAALEARRFAAARLFARGASQATIVKRFGVSRQTRATWFDVL
jgi:transposase